MSTIVVRPTTTAPITITIKLETPRDWWTTIPPVILAILAGLTLVLVLAVEYRKYKRDVAADARTAEADAAAAAKKAEELRERRAADRAADRAHRGNASTSGLFIGRGSQRGLVPNWR